MVEKSLAFWAKKAPCEVHNRPPEKPPTPAVTHDTSQAISVVLCAISLNTRDAKNPPTYILYPTAPITIQDFDPVHFIIRYSVHGMKYAAVRIKYEVVIINNG